jgi:hypothetical protein
MFDQQKAERTAAMAIRPIRATATKAFENLMMT